MADSKAFKGVIPIVKSFFHGSRSIDHTDYRVEDNGTDVFHWFKSNYKFSKQGLFNLVEHGYRNNPIGFAVINKISLSQKELILKPYRNGEPLEKESLPFDSNSLFFFYILTGSAILWKRNITGVGISYEVINPLFLNEIKERNVFKYTYCSDGLEIPILESDLIFLHKKNPLDDNTKLGLCPLQASLMPIESLNEMYLADASLLKNKGADVIITNGSDTPITGVDSDEMDKELNRRYAGAKKHGKLITSTANLKAHTIGRTTKELALWDGYKIKLRDVCNVFNVDPSHFGDPESKKFSNVNEAKKGLYTNCVIPKTRDLTDNPILVNELGYDIFIDTSAIDALQEDQETRAKKNKMNTDAIIELNKQVQDSILTEEIAIQILVTEWNYDEEEARNYIGERVERESGEGGENESEPSE